MENIKSFISKKIITLQGEKIGYILNGVFDRDFKSFLGFVLVDEESEEEFLLEREDIFSCGDDCVIIENSQKIHPLILLTNFTFIGREVYSSDGTFLGFVRDVFFEKGEVKKILCDRGEILSKNVMGAGEGCVIVGRKKRAKNINSFPKSVQDNRSVQVSLPNNIPHNSPSQKPIKFMGNIDSVIGKIMKENLLGLNNEVIAKKGGRINKKIISKALSHGRGNMLLFLSE